MVLEDGGLYIQKVKGFFVKVYLEEEIFKGGAGLCLELRKDPVHL